MSGHSSPRFFLDLPSVGTWAMCTAIAIVLLIVFGVLPRIPW
jgi:hypothetical protein